MGGLVVYDHRALYGSIGVVNDRTSDNAENPDREEGLPSHTWFPRWLAASALAGVPFVVALTRSMWLTRGDITQAIEVLQRVNLAALLLGSAARALQTPLIPMTLGAYRQWLMRTTGKRGAQHVYPKGIHLGLCGLFTLIALMTQYGHIRAWGITAGAGLASAIMGTRDFNGKVPDESSGSQPSIGVAVTTLICIALAIGISVTTMYPSPEVVRRDGSTPEWVYVLEVGEQHTTILHVRGGIERVENDLIKERAVCPESKISQANPPYAPSLLRRALSDPAERVPDLCKQVENVEIRG